MEYKHIFLKIPIDLHKKLKLYSTECGITMTALINNLIEKELKKGGY